MGFLSRVFCGKSGGAKRFQTRKASEDYSGRLASLWMSDRKGPLRPQLWLHFQFATMAESVASQRPATVEQYLAGPPEVVEDADGSGDLVFLLRAGEHIIPLIEALVPVLSGRDGKEKPALCGGAAVKLPDNLKSKLTYFLGGQALQMGQVISW